MPEEWMRGLVGGGMIGLAAAAFLLGTGRVMGASGLIAGLVDRSARGTPWSERALFVAGLALAPAALVWLAGAPTATAVVGWPLLILAGLLVGFGSRLANGCTSGHGVCGVSRLAPRGLAATATYMGFGVLGVLATRWLGWA